MDVVVSEYLHIRKNEGWSSTRVTDVYDVFSTRQGTKLGVIKWYGQWRQYAFFPAGSTIWNPDCLREVADKCAELTREHREAKK